MTLLGSKSGSQPETFGVFKQKLGKQHSWGFKQHFASTTINHEQKTVERKEKKSVKSSAQEAGKEDDRNVDEKRGFVPSDVNDPTKREFLSQLSKRIFTEQRTQNLFSKLRVFIQEVMKIIGFHDLLCRNAIVLISDFGLPYSDMFKSNFWLTQRHTITAILGQDN